ncbi:MAG: TRAP transporter large permease [Calditrichaeota bacterium]|nr:TRAP transporter large permease [Calditrichota bacterium]MCB0270276.1 TRAP transporter large permease [Calditrichota bacterium]
MTIDVFILVASFAVLLMLNVPIAVSIGLSTMLTLMVNVDFTPAVSTIAQRVATGLDKFTLLAIPFFILSGTLMARGGLAKRLVEFAKALVGSFPGGLALVNIISSMLFGAISGSAVASAAAIGSFMHPRMVENGYDPGFSAAVNVTSATTGLIIPPSNVLIIYSLASGGVSIGALFIAGYIPGTILGLALMAVAAFIAKKEGYGRGERVSVGEVGRRLGDALLSLTLIFIVIGGIVAGIFTATEAAAIAVIYALILAMFVYREIKFSDLESILLESAGTTAVVMLLIGTSMALSWVLSYENIPQNITTTLLALSENKLVILLIMNLVLLIVGTFMDMTPAILIFTPVFLPVAQTIGIDPLLFGIMMVLNLCIGLCTPPVGTVLFVGCGVAKVSLTEIVKPLLPMYVAMIFALILIVSIPELTLALPRWFGF